MPVVIVVGSSNLDFTVTVERLPAVGETVLGGALQEAFGGKGANQALAARLAGAEVRLLTKLGADEHGRRIAAHLTGLGLPRKGLLQEATAPTGVALILVDRQGRNVIAVAPGANQALRVEDVRRAEPLLDGGQVLLAQLEIPLACVTEAFRRARARRLFTILNPAPAMSLPASLYPLIDLLTPNAREAEALTGLREPEAAARALVGRGAGAVVVTLGEQGALLCQG
ncbi:MAG: ribokinase, partial [Nitrospirales bacterium]